MRLSIAFAYLTSVLALGGTTMSAMAAGNIRIGTSHDRVLQEQEVTMSEDALAECMDKIASFHGLHLEPMSSFVAHELIVKNPTIWSQFCSINLKAVDSVFERKLKDTEQVRTLQSGPGYFTPDYPSGQEIENFYSDFLISENISDLKERCDSAKVAEDMEYLRNAELADEAAEAACGGFAFGCFVSLITGTVVTHSNAKVEACNFHDGNVDGAEIEATFENVKTLMKDERDHFGALTSNINAFKIATNARFGTVDVNIADFETGMNARFDTVDVNIADFETATNARFDTVDVNIADFETGMNARFDTVDVNIADFETATNARFDTVDAAFAALNIRLDTIEKTLENRFNQVDTLLAMLRTLAITPIGSRTGWNSGSDICDGNAVDGNCALVANYPL